METDNEQAKLISLLEELKSKAQHIQKHYSYDVFSLGNKKKHETFPNMFSVCSKAVLAKRFIEMLECHIDWQDKKSMRNISTAISVGILIGELEVFNPDGEYMELHKEIIASDIGKSTVNCKRWLRIEPIKDELVSQAKVMWESGSLLLHNDMAEQLLKNNPSAASSISKPVLMAALKPIANNYGKVRGAKGVRKEKLPPK